MKNIDVSSGRALSTLMIRFVDGQKLRKIWIYVILISSLIFENWAISKSKIYFRFICFVLEIVSYMIALYWGLAREISWRLGLFRNKYTVNYVADFEAESNHEFLFMELSLKNLFLYS